MDIQKLTGVLQDDKIAVKDKLNHSIDLIERPFKLGGGKDAVVFYMSGVTDTKIIYEYIIKPLINMEYPEKPGPAYKPAAPLREGSGESFLSKGLSFLLKDKERLPESAAPEGQTGPAKNTQNKKKAGSVKGGLLTYILENVIEAGEVKVASSMDELSDALIYGDCVILLEGESTAIIAAARFWEKRGITEPPNSAVLRGPREGFTEDMKGNTVQIRRRLRTPDLIFEVMPVGRYSRTNVTVAYIKGIADESIVKKVMKRIKAIDIDGVVDSFYIQHFLEERKSSIFKQVNYCEKPDIAAAKMLEGRIAIIVDGSPIVLTLPYLYLEDLQSSQDYYTRSPLANAGVIIRFISLFIAIFLPGFYVSMQVFHYNILPIKMIVTLTNAIQGTPFVPLIEMLIVTFLFIIIHEASLRMPKYVGMAMSIVGALILGDTAVKAGIISSPSVLVAAISMLASHLVPDQASTTDFVKTIFIIVGGLMGILGLVAGAVFLITYMSSLDSYGAPFFAPFSPLIKEDLKDSVIKKNLAGMKTRPVSIPGPNKTRLGEMEDTGDEA